MPASSVSLYIFLVPVSHWLSIWPLVLLKSSVDPTTILISCFNYLLSTVTVHLTYGLPSLHVLYNRLHSGKAIRSTPNPIILHSCTQIVVHVLITNTVGICKVAVMNIKVAVAIIISAVVNFINTVTIIIKVVALI